MTETYDVVVVGAGPAGRHAAIEAARRGSVACVDPVLGIDSPSSQLPQDSNVCATPSERLRSVASRVAMLARHAKVCGVMAGARDVSMSALADRVEAVVRHLTAGVAHQLKGNRVALAHGQGRVLPRLHVEVIDMAGHIRTLRARKIVFASGSVPLQLDHLPCDGENIVDAVDALTFAAVPARLIVIGGGSVGLEIACLWHRLGSDATVLDACSPFLPEADADIAQAAWHELTRRGIRLWPGARVHSGDQHGPKSTIRYRVDGREMAAAADKIVVAVGRRPATDALWGDATGILRDETGHITVDKSFKTGVEGISAVGDCAGTESSTGWPYAERIVVADVVAGHSAGLSLHMPSQFVYTEPEIAWLGLTEQQTRDAGIPYRAEHAVLGGDRANATAEGAENRVKTVIDRASGRVLGVHAFGLRGCHLIRECAAALERGNSADQVAAIVQAHLEFTLYLLGDPRRSQYVR